MARLPLSNFQYQFQNFFGSESSEPGIDGRNVLTLNEETTVIELIKRYISQALPPTRSDIADAVEIIDK